MPKIFAGKGINMSGIQSTPNTNTGDVVGTQRNASPSDAYYRFRLMEQKLRLVSSTDAKDAKVKEVLGQMSEREAIELGILQKLMKIKESSPEFAQVVDITGTEDRFLQAEKLADAVYKKARAEKILSFYTPTKADLDTYIGNAVDTGNAERKSKTDIWSP